ncbi:MAG TPA: fimbrial protein [Rhodanobacteraceae bacterium]|jgi:type 1 fimbria pilin|nr:fimbrial protein [Rhodanobacteraceae bacterium]
MSMRGRGKDWNVSGPRPLSWRPQPRFLGTALALLVLFCLSGVPRAAWATCWFTSGSATTVTFNAGTITLTPSTTVGTVLWTSNTAAPANPPVLACDGNTNGGIVNTIAGPPTSGNTVFPTGIPGISYSLTHPDPSNLLAAYPDYPTDSGTFNVASQLELIYTGPFLPPNNSTLTGQLSQWKVDICSRPILFLGFYLGCNGTVSPQPVETFNISATIRIQVPTCNVAAGSVNKTVTLPTATTLQFSSQPTAGKTPFSLQLTNCVSNLGVFITLNSTNALSGVPGVIAPSGAGFATGIGVQILEADGATAVPFGSPIDTGVTTSSNYNINFYAQYYKTGGTVSAGPVQAIATYTLNYQ